MRTMQFLVGAGFAALIACAPVMAQEMPAPPPPGAPGMHHPGMDGPDMPDRRAPITRAEVEKMITDHFAMLDTNKDGVVTRAELDAFRDKRHDEIKAAMETRRKEHLTRMFDRLDTNHDGAISREEFAAAMQPPPGGPPPPGAMAGRDGPGPMEHGPMGHRMERVAMRDHRPGPMGGPAMLMGARWFDLVVDDHGGKVTLAEVKKGALTLFDRLDLNHDGALTPDEQRMAFRGMHWHRGPAEG